jgi:hypothetical protein
MVSKRDGPPDGGSKRSPGEAHGGASARADRKGAVAGADIQANSPSIGPRKSPIARSPCTATRPASAKSSSSGATLSRLHGEVRLSPGRPAAAPINRREAFRASAPARATNRNDSRGLVRARGAASHRRFPSSEYRARACRLRSQFAR